MQSAVAGLLIGTWSYAILALSRAGDGVAAAGGPVLVLVLAGVYLGVLPWAAARSKLPAPTKLPLVFGAVLVIAIVIVSLDNSDVLLGYIVFLGLSAGYVWLLVRMRSSISLASWVFQVVLALLVAITVVTVGWAVVAFE